MDVPPSTHGTPNAVTQPILNQTPPTIAENDRPAPDGVRRTLFTTRRSRRREASLQQVPPPPRRNMEQDANDVDGGQRNASSSSASRENVAERASEGADVVAPPSMEATLLRIEEQEANEVQIFTYL